ncbi:PUA domain-containing protein [Candidatus Nitrosocosmicus franklandus]|uniref:H/ACA RNA-protein complex component Cbf5p n=1 Tax=Candidatus Nitrosocosmicus franklandianus TaxID=1798806 RepID=A0A484IA71_9ARCH|nr:PUA domain-containing protein [Candidatus Nitrosocosmicus franklandus]VFJ14632.1 H/ACA RNA-protein complex component Cbf5p [Candidatus Nitrosocosmicus franklandus]
MSKKDTERILKGLEKSWAKVTIPKTKNIKIFEIEENKSILIIDSMVAVLTANESILPFLGKTEILDIFPSVTVDSGSIKFICNGAKILRPGIVGFDSFKKNEIVTVKDEKFKKYLAIGLALEDSDRAQAMEKGQIINNLHFVGDKYWNAFKEISFRI